MTRKEFLKKHKQYMKRLPKKFIAGIWLARKANPDYEILRDAIEKQLQKKTIWDLIAIRQQKIRELKQELAKEETAKEFVRDLTRLAYDKVKTVVGKKYFEST